MPTIGTCSKCNGPVQVPDLWGGTVPPVPTCAHCGATAKDPYGPIMVTMRPIPMEKRSPSRTGAQQPPSAPVKVSWADFWIAQGDWPTANDYDAFEKAERWLRAQQPLSVTVLPDITQLQRYKIEPMLTNNNWFTRAYRRDDGRWVEWHDVEEMFLRAKRAQQSAAVDEAMVERALNARYNGYDVACYIDEKADGRGVIRAALTAALAQQPAAGDGEVDCRCIDCGGNQPGHDPTCSYMHELHGEQPAAVDGAMVERIAALLHEEATAEPWTVAGVEHPGPDRGYYRGLARKVAALAAQHGAGDEVLTPTGTFCSVCEAPQHNTPSGVSCPRGHGGAEPLTAQHWE